MKRALSPPDYNFTIKPSKCKYAHLQYFLISGKIFLKRRDASYEKRYFIYAGKASGGDSVDEKQIIDLLFKRDQSAIVALSEKYSKAILSLSKNVLGDSCTAEECLNDTLLALWNNIPPERPEHLYAYVLKIARNVSLKRARHDSSQKRRGAVRDLALDELYEVADKSEAIEGLMASELGSRISAFAKALGDADRAIFIKRYFLYESVKKIASELDFGESRVKMSLSRSRTKLYKILKKEGYVN